MGGGGVGFMGRERATSHCVYQFHTYQKEKMPRRLASAQSGFISYNESLVGEVIKLLVIHLIKLDYLQSKI